MIFIRQNYITDKFSNLFCTYYAFFVRIINKYFKQVYNGVGGEQTLGYTKVPGKDYRGIFPDKAQGHDVGLWYHGGVQHDAQQVHPIRDTSLVPQFCNPEVQEHKNGLGVGG